VPCPQGSGPKDQWEKGDWCGSKSPGTCGNFSPQRAGAPGGPRPSRA